MNRKYQSYQRSIKRFLENYRWRAGHYPTESHVKRITGSHGMRKTDLALKYCHRHTDTYYLSFKDLDQNIARRFFANRFDADIDSTTWRTFFQSILDSIQVECIVLFFDDIDDRDDKEDFYDALYEVLLKDKDRRMATVLITNKPIGRLTYRHDFKSVSVSLGEICKEYPKMDRKDALRLFSISGGIHEIVDAYDYSISFSDNLKLFLSEGSAFDLNMYDLLSDFRSPESYNSLLYAMSIGMKKPSEIAKFAGYSYNKCDKYLRNLIEAGLISKVEHPNKNMSVGYGVDSSYIKFWYRYVYPNRHFMRMGFPDELISEIIAFIDNDLAPESFTVASMSNYLNIRKSVIEDGSFKRNVVINGYTFDAIAKEWNGDNTFLVKIFPEMNSSFVKEDLEKLRKAVELLQARNRCDIYLYLNGRFSEYVWKESKEDDQLHPIEPRSINDLDRDLGYLNHHYLCLKLLQLQELSHF